jgi:predicted histone-like DNA-binding protein
MKYELIQRVNPQNPAGTKLWYAIARLLDKMSPEELCRRIWEVCTVTPADVEAVFTILAIVAAEQLKKNGSIYIRGIGTLRVGLDSAGVEIPEDFTPSCILGNHLIFTPDKKLVDALQNLHYEADSNAGDHGIRISWLRDQTSGTSNDKITRGGMVHLRGNMIMIGGDDAAVGLKLVSADTGVAYAVPTDNIAFNRTTRVIFNAPADLPDGGYRVRIVTQITSNPKKPLKSLHAFTYEPILTAVNPESQKPVEQPGSTAPEQDAKE